MEKRATRTLKRGIDVLGATVALLVLCPLLVCIAAVLLIAQGRPLFFRQQRAGYRGKAFNIRKFRTMSNATGPDGTLLGDADRVTPVGRWLRRTSLDELPELLNVLSGDMSLVGPRPLPVAYLPLYNVEQRRRHEVRPGLTGLAQVHGRNGLSWEQRFAYDLDYTDRMSLVLDVKIIWRTVAVVVSGGGVNAAERVTSEPFRGTLN